MVVRFISAENMRKDDFGVRLTREVGEVVYDGRTRQGPWATMTQQSWEMYGCGSLGTGNGQKFVRRENGELHKEEG